MIFKNIEDFFQNIIRLKFIWIKIKNQESDEIFFSWKVTSEHFYIVLPNLSKL